jgi:hypothetical protein
VGIKDTLKNLNIFSKLSLSSLFRMIAEPSIDESKRRRVDDGSTTTDSCHTNGKDNDVGSNIVYLAAKIAENKRIGDLILRIETDRERLNAQLAISKQKSDEAKKKHDELRKKFREDIAQMKHDFNYDYYKKMVEEYHNQPKNL